MPRLTNRVNTLPNHKPGCHCPPCKGKAKAIASRAGDGRDQVEPTPPQAQPQDVVHADGLPLIIRNDRSARARVAQIVKYRIQGLTNKEIAEKLDLAHGFVRNLISKAAKEGWLKFEDPIDRFENEIVPKVVDNIDYWIEKKDKRMTIEAAKGAGIFKSHQALRIDGAAPQTVLALKIEMPSNGEEAKAVTGHIVGKPRQLRASDDAV